MSRELTNEDCWLEWDCQSLARLHLTSLPTACIAPSPLLRTPPVKPQLASQRRTMPGCSGSGSTPATRRRPRKRPRQSCSVVWQSRAQAGPPQAALGAAVLAAGAAIAALRQQQLAAMVAAVHGQPTSATGAASRATGEAWLGLVAGF